MSTIATVGEYTIENGPSIDLLKTVADLTRAKVPLRDKTVVFTLKWINTEQKTTVRAIITGLEVRKTSPKGSCIHITGVNVGTNHGKLNAWYDPTTRTGVLEITGHRIPGLKKPARRR